MGKPAVEIEPIYDSPSVDPVCIEHAGRGKSADTVVDIFQRRQRIGADIRIVGREFGVRQVAVEGGRSKRDNPDVEFSKLRAAIPDIQIPRTSTYEEFSKAPFFPVMVKHTGLNRGEGKYVLDNVSQWERMKCWIVANVSAEDIGQFAFQELVPTPGDFYTSYRVLISCTGTVLACSLIYSGNKKSEEEKCVRASREGGEGAILSSIELLEMPSSPYFLDARRAVSNLAYGGGCIVLNPLDTSTKPNALERDILADHGLDPDKPQLPRLIEQQSRQIVEAKVDDSRRIRTLYYGIDWIQDARGKERYVYLETNRRPAIQAYIDRKWGEVADSPDVKHAAYVAATREIYDELSAQWHCSLKLPFYQIQKLSLDFCSRERVQVDRGVKVVHARGGDGGGRFEPL